MSAQLPLRDVLLPPSPAWWPPPPGWWLLLLAVVLALAVWAWLAWRRRQQRRRWQHSFDGEVAAAADGSARVAAIAGLLRRAQRQAAPGSEALQGAAWLARIDPQQALDASQRQLLLQGAYRPVSDDTAVEALRLWARGRFLALLQERGR